MELNTVQLLGNESNIEQLILKSLGKNVKFFNGCTVCLMDDDGIFWGTDPYGLVWACYGSDNWVKSILNWFKYWDESRDETGALIN